jgi:hypothetical protein
LLHRLALRVLPSLALAVTDDPVRRRKRLIMALTGFGAFVAYRACKAALPLSHPLVLLAVSGSVSGATALIAYRIGRLATLSEIWKDDGIARLAWLAGWVGFVYGVQLSLLVLALLRTLVNYDFLRHPEGPAMMAIVIASTSVARDTFEIGRLRWLQRAGMPVPTFPDGALLRALAWEQPGRFLPWCLVGGGTAFAAAVLLSASGSLGESDIAQLSVVATVGGTAALWAYLAGWQGRRGLRASFRQVAWPELFRFWWWPGLAFAATYYLVLLGFADFLLRLDGRSPATQAAMAGLVAGLMALYGYYLGRRRLEEDLTQQAVPPGLLRCPFVLDILGKKGNKGGTLGGGPRSGGERLVGPSRSPKVGTG